MRNPQWKGRIAEINREGRSLPALLAELENRQINVWPALREGIDALRQIEYRQLDVNGASISLQHNPGRIVSSSAKVDQKSIAERPCFLCPANLPMEEQGIEFDEAFVLFFNPMPVLPSHIVAIYEEHVPQRIAGSVSTFLKLTTALGEGFAVIYNGPRCGASAPDHLHFQAVSSARLPILEDANLENYPARFLLLVDEDEGVLEQKLNCVVQTLAEISGAGAEPDEEPMINLMATVREGKTRIYVFPRSKHRPESFFKTGEAQRMISPAALDLAGIVVAPRRVDFDRLTDSELGGIFSEVTIGTSQFETLSRHLKC